MIYVLTFKNKSGEPRYYNMPRDEHSWYDCDSVTSAHKFPTREEADAMRTRLNTISRRNKWYGRYQVKVLNS